MNLIFVRHGQSEWNKENKFTGWVDVGLSEKGKLEAIEAGKVLFNAGFAPNICYTSYLTRSKDTAKHILSELPIDESIEFPIKNLWQLNERHYGALQGLDKIDTANKYGEDQVQQWRRGYKIKPPLVEKDSKYNPNNDLIYKDIQERLPLYSDLRRERIEKHNNKMTHVFQKAFN